MFDVNTYIESPELRYLINNDESIQQERGIGEGGGDSDRESVDVFITVLQLKSLVKNRRKTMNKRPEGRSFKMCRNSVSNSTAIILAKGNPNNLDLPKSFHYTDTLNSWCCKTISLSSPALSQAISNQWKLDQQMISARHPDRHQARHPALLDSLAEHLVFHYDEGKLSKATAKVGRANIAYEIGDIAIACGYPSAQESFLQKDMLPYMCINATILPWHYSPSIGADPKSQSLYPHHITFSREGSTDIEFTKDCSSGIKFRTLCR